MLRTMTAIFLGHVGNNVKDKSTRPLIRSTVRSLPIAMLRARENVMAPLRKMLQEGDVTEQQWRVLRVLAEGGEMDPKDIAHEACLLSPSLTRIMQTLEKKEFIHRRPHTHDRRRVVVSIAKKGRATIDQLAPTSNQIMARIEAQYGKARFDELVDLLNLLSDVEI